MAELASVVDVPVLPSELTDESVAGTAANIDIDGFNFDFLQGLRMQISSMNSTMVVLILLPSIKHRGWAIGPNYQPPTLWAQGQR